MEIHCQRGRPPRLSLGMGLGPGPGMDIGQVPFILKAIEAVEVGLEAVFEFA